MRPGSPADLPHLLELWRRHVRAGDLDAIPAGEWLERIIADVDWAARSRVVEGGRGIEAAVIVLDRPTTGGAVARIEFVGEPVSAQRLLGWGLRLSRALGAAAAQVWRGRGRGEAMGLHRLGLRVVRPFWRMDRPALERLPEIDLPPGYRLVTDQDGLPDSYWVDTYNASFAEHWRHTPMTPEAFRHRRTRPGRLFGLDLMAVDPAGEPAALVMSGVEHYADDDRRQPVGVVGIVGTLPAHRRRGLARALVSHDLRRLRAAGARSATLYVDGLNPTRAHDVYRGLGFEVAFELEVWETYLS